MRRWDGLVDRYEERERARGLADSTIANRVRELFRFGGWLKGRRPRPKLDEVGRDLLVGYITSRTAFRSKSTVVNVTSVLRSMGEFLVDEGVWRQNPMRWVRGPKLDSRSRVPRRIPSSHITALWEAARSRRDEHSQYQCMALLAVLHSTGLRRGELGRLNVSDWDSEQGTLRIDGRKTGQERVVPVGESVWKCVEAYLPHRHNVLERTERLDEQALLVTRSGSRLEGLRINATLTRLSKAAGVPAPTPHQFRHSCASDLLESGVELPKVQRVLGHATVQSTVRYAAVADPARAEAMSRHPINALLGHVVEGGEEAR